VFVLTYIHLANRDFLGLRGPGLWAATAAALPAIAGLAALFGLVPFVASSAVYAGVWGLIVLYGLGLLARAPATGRGLLIGAGILGVSIASCGTSSTPSCWAG